MRRFSRSSSQRNSQNSATSTSAPQPLSSNRDTQPSGTGAYTPPLSGQSAPNGGIATNATSNIPGGAPPGYHGANDSRPISAASNSSFDFLHRPVSHHQPHPVPPSTMSGLSRTDQVVLRYFWEDKYADNAKRDLHFLKFPHFPQYPSHTDLMPYCEIYHLVKTSPGASIISLGSANGVYIGFELAQGAQLHIDMDDEWRDISHHRVLFKPYEQMLRDPTSNSTFQTWPKPLTIEFLEEQYRKWMMDLTSVCWVDEPVRELGGGSVTGGPSGAGTGRLSRGSDGDMGMDGRGGREI
ncbi:hypothetical protein OHC33_010572 [Knufia fluminis]|uniref:Uncharacterized protein n=1 Tax=Knufia fluminis TaxID=191047 RepID=A0AAN8ECW0_9EURO|nr:hypothetical protein OHC33_010572 [Knufia fluminis]